MNLRVKFFALLFVSGLLLQSFTLPELPLPSTQVEMNETSVLGCFSEIDWKGNQPSVKAFNLAYQGYHKLMEQGQLKNNRFLTVMDFSLSANQKRLWTIDLHEHKLLYHELVAHGMGTGEEFARHFSNQPESHKSSLGFYVTGEIYLGKHNESLKLHGLENGFNNKAYERGIVIHAANYVSEDFIQNHSRLGRSHGCPAVRPEINLPFIETIKGGSVVFIYFPDQYYLKNSPVLKS